MCLDVEHRYDFYYSVNCASVVALSALGADESKPEVLLTALLTGTVPD